MLPTEAVVTTPILMMTLADIAKRDGVARPGVSRTAKRMIESHGLSHERDARGRIARINVAEYDHLRSKFGDPSHVQAPPPAAGRDELPLRAAAAAKGAESFEEAKRQLAWIDAERARMRFAEEKGQLLRTESVLEALGTCAAEICNIIDRLPGVADEMAATAARDGAHGVRVTLKTLAQKMRTEIADALAAIAAAAPAFEQEEAS